MLPKITMTIISSTLLIWLLILKPTRSFSAIRLSVERILNNEQVRSDKDTVTSLFVQAPQSYFLQEKSTSNNANLSCEQHFATTRRSVFMAAITTFVTTQLALRSNADVSDGNSLPQGALQFARTIKLKTDLKDVTKRLLSVTDDNPIDKKEWDNISKFLRTIYSIADNDMKAIAKGLSYNPPNQKQANNDIDEIKKYSQAGDVSASKQDTTRLASILTKISELLDDFLLSLSDVPDEI